MKRKFGFILLYILISGKVSGQLILSQPNTTGTYSHPNGVQLRQGFSSLGFFLATTNGSGSGTVPIGSDRYIIENVPREEIKDLNLLNSSSVDQVNKSFEFFDVFGRTTQTILQKGSPTQKDVVQHYAYNNLGQQTISFQPYVGQNSVGTIYRPDASTEQKDFYSSQGWADLVKKTDRPFSEVLVEQNFLNSSNEMSNPGISWDLASGHTIRNSTLLNNLIDYSDITNTRKVAKYKVQYSAQGIPSLVSDGFYPLNSLIVKISKDENWKSTDGRINTKETYIDGEGKLIMERSFVLDQNQNTKILSSYLVYDNRGLLVYSLPPNLAPDLGTINAQDLLKYGSTRTYDINGNLLSSQNPATSPVYFVYNKKNQLVAKQTPNQREKNEWTFTKYDELGRIIQSGIWNNGNIAISAKDLKTEIDKNSTLFELKTSGGAHGYSISAWPTTAIAKWNFVNYYDNYIIPNVAAVHLTYENFTGVPNINIPTGQLTANKVFSDETIQKELWNINFYSQRGELLQVRSNNHLGGRDVVSYTYNFSGEVLESVRFHLNSSNALMLTVVNKNKYDHVGRLIEVRQKIDNQEEIILNANQYNELGQLVDKKVHKKASGSKFLQSIDYRYNERGWLTSINDADLGVNSDQNDGDADSSPDLFGMQINYNEGSQTPQYNGNISAQRWKTSKVSSQNIAPPKMGYQFQYDNLNRMTSALSEKNNSLDNSHNEIVAYDDSGNIQSINRSAFVGNSIQDIDKLTLSYDGYRLKKIDDLSTATQKKLGFDDKQTAENEYVYDGNGNVIKDLNKAVEIQYNDNNLITKIIFNNDPNDRLEFVYTRDGDKLQSKYIKNTVVETTDYLDGIIYRQNQISFVLTGEGRARKNGSVYVYEYDLTDHLGNVRVTYTPDPNDATQTLVKVLQQNSYYPYGMSMYGDASNGLHLSYVSGEKSKYLYSSKELYDQGGLNWYDHGARMYDPSTGRWSSMDPAGQFVNPYLAMGNNPVIFRDPNGEWINLAIGALIGGFTNWITHGAQFNAKGLGYFGAGAAAGAIGAGVGGGVSSVLGGGAFGAGFVGSSSAAVVGSGFMSGSLVGAAGGAAGGFALGAGNSLVNGEGFGAALKSGAISGGIGLLTGGVMGGISSGFDAMSDGRDFWTGAGTSTEYFGSPMAGPVNSKRYASREDLFTDYNNTIGKKDGLSLEAVEKRLDTYVDLETDPKRLSPTGHIIPPKGKETSGLWAGSTSSKHSGGFWNKSSSTIHIAPAVKGYALLDKNNVFKHEFIHAYHYMKGFSAALMNKFSESAATDYSFQYIKHFKLSNVQMSYIQKFRFNYPAEFSWRNVNKYVPLWIK